ncbi:MAG: biopolymer transporter ExbD [Dysgonamonadaceae bacterium]|jgi:biopolymer transport protein ExbD|nr:biopolymer transporter ExbD [Dysgonamonadaceae bacterium]
MSEVQVQEKGGEGKARQKKQSLRVDFTPMVDMNMLLITFFMFSTTLLKPQVMNITMPAKDQVEDTQKNKIAESTAVTILMGANNNIYYYEGLIESQEQYDDPNLLQQSAYGEEGIRQVLLRKNKMEIDGKNIYDQVQALKEKKQKEQITEADYNTAVKDIQDRFNKAKKAPNVLIKPTDQATYKNMVDVLDEMLVCNIGFYQIAEPVEGDRHLLYKKTGNLDYLTDAQKATLVK